MIDQLRNALDQMRKLKIERSIFVYAKENKDYFFDTYIRSWLLGYGAYRSETEAMEACIYGVPLKEVSNVFTFLCSAFRNYDVVYSIHPGYIAKTTKEEFLQMVDLALKINPILHEKNISSQPEQWPKEK